MAKSQMLTQLMALTGESDESLLTALLSMAEGKVLERLYPFDDTKSVVPYKHRTNVLEIALYLYNKRGAEGEIAHSEGDISRTYESAGIPDSLFRGIISYGEVI